MAHSPVFDALSPPVQINLFGTLHVVQARAQQAPRSLRPSRQSASLLLAYLVLHAPAPIPRSRLAGVLAPDCPEAQARRILTDTLYHLRQELDETHRWLQADADAIRLELSHVQVDVHEFTRLAASSDPPDWQRALTLYRADLLEDLDAEWLLPQRAQLREHYLALLERVCTALIQANDLTGALTYAQRWSLADPLREEAHTQLMRLYARLARHAAALQQFERLKQTLAAELAAEPLAETRRLAAAIRVEYAAQSQMDGAQAPFIGRRHERAQLLRLVEQAQAGHGSLSLLEGEAGIGKTRLLESLAEGASWRGLHVAWGRAREFSGTPLYTPLLEALQSTLSTPRAEQLRGRLAPRVLAVLAPVLPALGASSAPLPDSPRGFDEAPSLAAALADLATALSQLSPYLLICDDVQWADDAFWDVIAQLAPSVGEQALCIVLSYRDEVRTNTRAWSALQALDREHAPARLILSGLSADESVALVRAWQPELDAETARSIHAHAHGNPLFVRELSDQPRARLSLASLFARRLSRRTSDERSALEAGAVLGRDFRHGTWQQLVSTSLIELVPALLHSRFITETEHGYSFQHDLVREHIYHSLEPARRRELHAQAAAVLQTERAEPGVMAWHYEQAEQWSESVRYYREAGERAYRVHALATTLAHVQHALRLLAHLSEPRAERLAIFRLRERVLAGLKPTSAEWEAGVYAFVQAAGDAGDAASLVAALQAQMEVHLSRQQWPQMEATAERAIALAQAHHDLAGEVQVRNALGGTLYGALERLSEADAHLERAVALAGQTNDMRLLIWTLENKGTNEMLLGRCAQARQTLERVLDLAADSAELRWNKAAALQTLGSTLMLLAHWQEGCERMQQSLQLKTEMQSDPVALLQVYGHLSFLAASMGLQTVARQAVEQLLQRYAAYTSALDAKNWIWIPSRAVEAYTLLGELALAERYLPELELAAATDHVRTRLTALRAWGRLRLAQGRAADALVPLARGAGEWASGARSAWYAEAVLLYVIAAARAGEPADARSGLAQVDAVLSHTEIAQFDVLRHYARYLFSDDPRDLNAARDEIARQVARFTNEQWRADFVNNVSLHREIESCWRALQPSPVLVRLARAGAPLGKALDASDYVGVEWTVDAGDRDASLLQREGKVALRRHRLRRLIAEARAQGAAPTDADLAHALGVNLRTVERDIAGLRSTGQPMPTRRRRA